LAFRPSLADGLALSKHEKRKKAPNGTVRQSVGAFFEQHWDTHYPEASHKLETGPIGKIDPAYGLGYKTKTNTLCGSGVKKTF
jgi:hypothetical protein